MAENRNVRGNEIQPSKVGSESNPVQETHTKSLNVNSWNWVDADTVGIDTTGETDASDAIQQAAANNTLLRFPTGAEIKLSSRIDLDGLSNFGMVTRDATIVLDADYTGTQVFTSPSSNPLHNGVLDGFTLDLSLGGTARFVSLACSGRSIVHNLTVVGEYDDYGDGHGGARFDMVDPNGTLEVTNLDLSDGDIGYSHLDTADQPPTGVLVGNSTEGMVRFVDCNVHEWRDNGLYASPASGPVVVEGGTYDNNGTANIRVGGDSSTVRNATISNEENVGYDGRAIYHRNGTGHRFESVEVRSSNPDGTFTPLFVHEDLAGSCTFDSCTFDMTGHGTRFATIQSADNPTHTQNIVRFDGCTFVGSFDNYEGDRLLLFSRPTHLTDCEVHIGSVHANVEHVAVLTADCKVTTTQVESPIQIFRGFSTAHRCQFTSNNLDANSETEITMSGDNCTAVGNVVHNGISGCNEAATEIVQ